MNRSRYIKVFSEINDCHAAMGFAGRTDLPGFHVYTMEETYPSTRAYMPPYALRFYSIVLLENSADALLDLNARTIPVAADGVLSFQAPGQTASWVRGAAQRGFILYFQPDFLASHPRPLAQDFAFLHAAEIPENALSLGQAELPVLRRRFQSLVEVYEDREHPYREELLRAELVALLFECRVKCEERARISGGSGRAASQPTNAPGLAARFLALLDRYCVHRQSVRDYAAMLDVSPNHLSRAVSAQLGRKAGDLIAERVATEAKRLLRYSDLGVQEISDYLGFEEPTHFSRFFKRLAGTTPRSFRTGSRPPVQTSGQERGPLSAQPIADPADPNRRK